MADRTEYFREYRKRNKDKLTEYQRDYSKNVRYKNYKKVNAFIDIELAEKFENKLLEDKTTITEFITKAIENYVKEV